MKDGSVLTFNTKRCLIGEEGLEQISNSKRLLYPVAHFSNSESKVLPGPDGIHYASSLPKAGRFRDCFSSHNFWKAGSARKGSQSGSSLRSAGVMGAGL